MPQPDVSTVSRFYIANFGLENYLWPECRAKSTVATIDDEDLRSMWVSGQREAYIEHCIRYKRTVRGLVPTRALASRWFNVHHSIADTRGDVWMHRDGADLWWTISNDELATESVQPAYKPRDPSQSSVVVIHKPTVGWSNKNLRGGRLDWAAIHPAAKPFLITEGTLQQLSGDNAEYARALIRGFDLGQWHRNSKWIAKEITNANPRGIVLDPIQAGVAMMATRARETARGANGQEVVSTLKNKDFGFDSYDEMVAYLHALLKDQDGLCALTGIKLQYPGELADHELQCSLDRIDSDGHYAPGNLQIVCKFANRWKNDSRDAEFRRLLYVVRQSAEF